MAADVSKDGNSDLTTIIADQASKPEIVSTPLGKVKNRSLTELIEADRYLSTSGKRSGWAAVRPARVIMPGPTE